MSPVRTTISPVEERGFEPSVPRQVDGFAALMSDDDKPFECVGERRESAAAMRMLSERPEWRVSPVVAALADRARAMGEAGRARVQAEFRADAMVARFADLYERLAAARG